MSAEGHVDFVKMRIKIYSIAFPLYYIMSYHFEAMKGYYSLLIKREVLFILEYEVATHLLSVSTYCSGL